VVWRRSTDGREIEVALIHRPKYDDWSFPKGKLDAGESDEEGALREVEEETAVTGPLGAELASVAYVDGKGRPKTVRYWALQAKHEGEFVPNGEVDIVRWVDLPVAHDLLSYQHDVDVLDSFAAAVGRLGAGGEDA
jgi:8-oxo-dGTP diphosphatase